MFVISVKDWKKIVKVAVLARVALKDQCYCFYGPLVCIESRMVGKYTLSAPLHSIKFNCTL